MNEPNPREVDDRIADWVDECMAPRERERFTAELRVNPKLRADLAAYERTVAAVRAALQAPTSPRPLADRVLAAIDAAAREPQAAPARRRWQPWVLSAVSAAALLVLAVWLDSWAASVDRQTTASEPPALREAAELLRVEVPAAPVVASDGAPPAPVPAPVGGAAGTESPGAPTAVAPPPPAEARVGVAVAKDIPLPERAAKADEPAARERSQAVGDPVAAGAVEPPGARAAPLEPPVAAEGTAAAGLPGETLAAIDHLPEGDPTASPVAPAVVLPMVELRYRHARSEPTADPRPDAPPTGRVRDADPTDGRAATGSDDFFLGARRLVLPEQVGLQMRRLAVPAPVPPVVGGPASGGATKAPSRGAPTAPAGPTTAAPGGPSSPGSTSPAAATVEQVWLVEGTAAEIAAFVRRLAELAQREGAQLANGEIAAADAGVTASPPAAAAAVPSPRMRLVVRVLRLPESR
jgi:hypothetical protein